MRKFYHLLVLTLLFPISSFAFIQGYSSDEFIIDNFCPTGGTHNSQPVYKTSDDVNWLYRASYGPHMYWVIGDSTLTDSFGSNWFVFSNTLNNTDPLVQSTWSQLSPSETSSGAILSSYDCEEEEPPATTTDDIATSTRYEMALGSINFGLAIIIVLFSLFVIAYIYNQFTNKKKPWQK